MKQTSLYLIAASLALTASAFAGDGRANAHVYTMNNSVNGNEILVYHRAANGSLTSAGSVATGGAGTGAGLGNQSAVILSANGNWLFACNAGSDEISVFEVSPRGLKFSDKVSSVGRHPISLALHGNQLFVLNTASVVGGEDRLDGFYFTHGKLIATPGATSPLSTANTAAAQVAFNHDGTQLIVTERATSVIDTFSVDEDGQLSEHKMFASPVPTPFGFAVSRQDRIFVSEANGGAVNASSLSSYELADNGDLIGLTLGASTTESAACWAALSPNGHYVYTANTGSGTVSGYRVNQDGTVELLNADGVTGVVGAGRRPIDLSFSKDGRFIYCLAGGANSAPGTITGFEVNPNGSLTLITQVGGVPVGSNGLAAR